MARPRIPPESINRVLTPDQFTLEDLEAARVLLRGGSVVDWHRLDFLDHASVDRFLRVNEYYPENPHDMSRLEALRAVAIDYLAHNFSFRIPDDIADGVPTRDLFLMASRRGKRQTWACVVLKVMHIVNHLHGRAAATRLPISDEKLARAIELKVMQVVEELRAAGYPISEFQWSRKPTDSLITKLLAKRKAVAANIYDKLRFRLIVKQRDDLLPMVAVLARRLIPFNYVVPGESVNHLISLRVALDTNDRLRRMADDMQFEAQLERQQERQAAAPLNEFSGKQYKIVNFVADLPVRLDAITEEHERNEHVLFVLTEFQLADEATAANNELGENNHQAYKSRQHQRVRQRLMRGSRRGRASDLHKLVTPAKLAVRNGDSMTETPLLSSKTTRNQTTSSE